MAEYIYPPGSGFDLCKPPSCASDDTEIILTSVPTSAVYETAVEVKWKIISSFLESDDIPSQNNALWGYDFLNNTVDGSPLDTAWFGTEFSASFNISSQVRGTVSIQIKLILNGVLYKSGLVYIPIS